MAKDTVTISLEGDVSLDDFAAAVARFKALVDGLTSEIAKGTTIRWVIADLSYGSTTATARGLGEGPEALPKVEEIVQAYGTVGHALETGDTIPFGSRIAEPAARLRELLSKRVPTIRFETADVDAVVTVEMAEVRPLYPPVRAAFGAVEGTVQALTNRGGLRFTLYDKVHDRPVSCYVQEGREDLLREIWGKVVVVEGKVSRDRVSARPLTVRQIRAIEPREEFERGSWRRARGAIALGKDKSEDIIRRMRDA